MIGIIAAGGPGPIEAFTTGLREWGYVVGQNIRLELRFANGDLRKLPDFAAEFVRKNADLVAVVGAVTARAVREATTDIPIVYSVVVDPIRDGLAEGIDQPRGNMTGVTTFDLRQADTHIQLLRSALPHLDRIAILSDQGVSDCLSDANARAIERAGLRPQIVHIGGPEPELDGAFSDMARERAEALIVLEHPINGVQSATIARFAKQRGLLTVFARDQSDANGLFSYGTSLRMAARRMASHTTKILKGGRAGELPVEVLWSQDLVVNLRTARALSLTVGTETLARATQIIE
jgi:putative ABC transport system substrate-binding protein